MTKDTGGQAYPTKLYTEQGYPGGYDMGMTLRDWFAGQALVAMGTWAPVEPEEWSHRDVIQKMRAEFAYEQADAMLATRQS